MAKFLEKLFNPNVYANDINEEDVFLLQLISDLKVRANGDVDSDILAGRLLYKCCSQAVTTTVKNYLMCFKNTLDGDVYQFIENNLEELEVVTSEFKNSRDFNELISKGYLSILRYVDTYLNKSDLFDFLESIEHFYMRIASFCTVQTMKYSWMKSALKVLCAGDNIPRVHCFSKPIEIFNYYYYYLTRQIVCCSTPILRNAGTKTNFLSSCFLVNQPLSNGKDVARALFEELNQLLMCGSGVGLGLSTYAQDKEILYLMKIINSQIEYHNDGNVRPVSVAAFIELWHKDALKFLYYKTPENDADRCKSMFQGLCIPAYFFKLYQNDPSGYWYVFDPSKVKLQELYGEEFEKEYERLVVEKKYIGGIPLRCVMYNLIDTAVKTGSPYILLKEACNEHYWKETQGDAINSSNLCAEIIQQCRKFTAICNLSNVRLSACLCKFSESSKWQDSCNSELYDTSEIFLRETDTYFSLAALRQATRCAVMLINCAILGGEYATDLAKKGAVLRSMGIGVQALADVFAELGLEYTATKSRILNKEIFEHMYFAALQTSNVICKHGANSFEGFEESKYKNGWFHWHGWDNVNLKIDLSRWKDLSESISKHGLFNSQFIALMPTAGGSQLTGCSESYYPFFSNMATKITNKSEALRPNYTFWKHVTSQDLPDVMRCMGKVSLMPKKLATKYARFKTAFDYDQKVLMDMARERAPFVDQSQSHSFFITEKNSTFASYMRDLFVYGFQLGLKTIMYYCRIEKEANLMIMQCLENSADSDSSDSLSIDEANAPDEIDSEDSIVFRESVSDCKEHCTINRNNESQCEDDVFLSSSEDSVQQDGGNNLEKKKNIVKSSINEESEDELNNYKHVDNPDSSNAVSVIVSHETNDTQTHGSNSIVYRSHKKRVRGVKQNVRFRQKIVKTSNLDSVKNDNCSNLNTCLCCE